MILRRSLTLLWSQMAAPLLATSAIVWASLAVVPEAQKSEGLVHKAFFIFVEASTALGFYYLIWLRQRIIWKVTLGLAFFHVFSAFWAGPFAWWIESPAAAAQVALLTSPAVRHHLAEPVEDPGPST